MSGICGYIDYRHTIEDHVLKDMVSSLAHRGPDNQGMKFSRTDKANVALGHTQMAVIDLIGADRQPMTFNGLTIVMDGVVYNFKEIRKELEAKGHSFLSNTDTEVVLHAFREWGQKCVDSFIGMFAFAIYDDIEHRFHLCRDRAGIKPLFYHFGNGFFAFASELMALMAIPQFNRNVSMEALSAYLKTFSIPGELSIFENTFKLNSGYWAEYRIDTKELIKKQYWDIEEYYACPKLKLSFDEAKAEVKHLLSSSLRYCLISNSPVGGFLSGGIDSSTVTAILAKEMGITPKVLTLGFEDVIDEVPAAKQIAKILGAQHFIKYCTEDDAIELIQRIPLVYDEPSADPSTIPTQLVCQSAKEHFPIVLSADGGDHLFAGFNTYIAQTYRYNRIKKYEWMRGFHHLPAALVKYVLPYNKTNARARIESFSGILNNKTLNYKNINDNYKARYQWIINSLFPTAKQYDCRNIFHDTGEAIASSPEYAMLSDFKFGMKDEVLVKMERASMAVSLDTREPMLDHRIIEFAAQLPWEYKCHHGTLKRILKAILYDYLPKELIDQPKHGFGAPITRWMHDFLKSMIYDELTRKNLEEMGFYPPKTLKLLDYFMKHEDQEGYISRIIWCILQYRLWFKYWIK